MNLGDYFDPSCLCNHDVRHFGIVESTLVPVGVVMEPREKADNTVLEQFLPLHAPLDLGHESQGKEDILNRN